MKVAVLLTSLVLTTLAHAADLTERSLLDADAEQRRIIVEQDAAAQAEFMHPNYILNGPSNRVLRKPVLVEMLGQGKMASESFERTIEGTAITGNVGIVMGSETVTPGRGSALDERFGGGSIAASRTSSCSKTADGASWRARHR